jgi:hypothetical protein
MSGGATTDGGRPMPEGARRLAKVAVGVLVVAIVGALAVRARRG